MLNSFCTCVPLDTFLFLACLFVCLYLDELTKEGISGAALSALDGVLVAVKDEIDCMPYPTTGMVNTPDQLVSCRILFFLRLVSVQGVESC